MSPRPKIPQHISDDLMFRNRHTCSICREPRKHVQIHHIDGNNANNLPANLSVLCLDCHSIVTAIGGLGRSYTQGEVIKYKRDWESLCTALNQHEEDEGEDEDAESDAPADSHYEEATIGGNTHLTHSYTLDEDDTVFISMESDSSLSVMIMNPEDYEAWNDTGHLECYLEHEDKFILRTSFVAPEDGEYLVVICNNLRDEAEYQLDISVWE